MFRNYFSFVYFFYFAISVNIYAQTTYVPDDNFEQALIDLGIDKDGIVNDRVVTADISGLTSLDIKYQNISDLTGIEDFMSLQMLFCLNNKLTSINLSKNTALTLLNCSNNQLTSLDLSQNTSLEEIYCSSNQLNSLNLSQNTSLEILFCHGNQLTNLVVSGATSLEGLLCDWNQLTSLYLSQNINLKAISCMGNQLTSLDLSQNTSLEEIYCSGNQITNLGLNQHPNLVKLYCYENQLTSLDLSQIPNLFTLSCFNNQITNLDLKLNPNLASLYCYNNQLELIDVSQNSKLQYFECDNNQLEGINLKNKGNQYLETFIATNNPSLICIQVDNAVDAYAGIDNYANWYKDNTASYAEVCQIFLSVDDELLAEDLKLYPNPVSDILIVDSKIPLHKVEIYSILGQKAKIIKSDFNSISTVNLSSGIYIVRMYSEKGTTVSKLIKK